MKLFKANKKEFNVGPFIKGVNFPLERFLLILLVLWLPLRELLFVGLSQLDQFGGLVAPVLVLITFLVLIARNGLKVKYGIVEVIFGIFLISSVISSLLSVTVYGQVWPVLKDLAVFFELFVLYLIGKNISREDFSTVVRIGITEALLISIYGIWQFIVKVPVNPLWVVPGESLRARAFATFDSPNSLAAYLLAWFWLSVWLGIKEKKAWLVGTLIIALGILFTYSRAILLSLVLSTGFILVLNYRKFNWKAIMAFLVTVLAAAGFFAKRLLNLLSPTYNLYSAEAGRSWAIRNVIHILPPHVFFGTGPGMYGGQTAASIPSPVYLESIQHGFVATYLTDNQYLQTLIQQGIFGLGLYLYLAYQIFLKLLLANKREIIFGSCVLAIWIGYSIQGIFENIFFIQASTTAIWIIIGQGLKGIE